MHARVALDLAGPNAPALVLVHGIGVASPYFVPTAEQLAPHFRVFAVDLPGFGLSDKPSHILDIAELADALAAWMRVEGLERLDAFLDLHGGRYPVQWVDASAARQEARVKHA